MTNLNTIDPAAILDEGKIENDDVVIGKSRIILRRFLRNRTAVAGLVIFLTLTLFSFIGGFFSSWDKETIDPFNIGMPPSAEHLLGTSQAGIDLYALTVEGTRVSILIGVVVGLVSVLIAAVYGCTMAYFGRKVDKVMLFILEALIMMPALLVVAVATSGGANGLKNTVPSWLLLIIVLLVFSWMGTARLIRSLSLSLMQRDFVKAAQYMGIPPRTDRLAAPRAEHRLPAGPGSHPRGHRRHPRRGRVFLHRHRHQGPGREPGRADRPVHLPGLHLSVDVLGSPDRDVPADRLAGHDERWPPRRVRPQFQLRWPRQEEPRRTGRAQSGKTQPGSAQSGSAVTGNKQKKSK